MREVRVPLPRALPGLSVTGPLIAAKDHAEASERLDRVLRSVPGRDRDQGVDGWTVLWRWVLLKHPGQLAAGVYCARSTGGAELLGQLVAPLQAEGFTVYVGRRPASIDPELTGPPIYVRSGDVQLGLDPRDEHELRAVRFVAEERGDVDLGRRFGHEVQRCPACGVLDHPARLVVGFPDEELLLAARFGEVAFSRGCDVDPTAREDAVCRHCRHEFVARRARGRARAHPVGPPR